MAPSSLTLGDSLNLSTEIADRPRRRGREERAPVAAAPFQQPRRSFAPVAIVSDDQVEAIHLASLNVLQDIGLDVLHDEARTILKNAGAEIDGLRS
jgi:trimethylamine---corrinoid protein Co-methyltransferase